MNRRISSLVTPLIFGALGLVFLLLDSRSDSRAGFRDMFWPAPRIVRCQAGGTLQPCSPSLTCLSVRSKDGPAGHPRLYQSNDPLVIWPRLPCLFAVGLGQRD